MKNFYNLTKLAGLIGLENKMFNIFNPELFVFDHQQDIAHKVESFYYIDNKLERLTTMCLKPLTTFKLMYGYPTIRLRCKDCVW